jgi:hypothetical protein
MQTRALVKERSQRNLLLLIDGIKTEEMLLANVAGVKPEDFESLQSLGLIAPVSSSSSSRSSHSSASSSSASAPATMPPAAAAEEPLDYSQFTTALTQLISSELGLRGFTLTLAVDKANSIEELREVATRVIDQIRDRKGLPAAEKARRTLFGA